MLSHVQGQVRKRVWIFEARSENGYGKWRFLVFLVEDLKMLELNSNLCVIAADTF